MKGRFCLLSLIVLFFRDLEKNLLSRSLGSVLNCVQSLISQFELRTLVYVEIETFCVRNDCRLVGSFFFRGIASTTRLHLVSLPFALEAAVSLKFHLEVQN